VDIFYFIKGDIMRLFIRLLNLNERGIETMVFVLLGTVLTSVGAILFIGSSVITGMMVIALGVFLFSNGLDRTIKKEVTLDPNLLTAQDFEARKARLKSLGYAWDGFGNVGSNIDLNHKDSKLKT
jgi:hypothetical protein